MRLTCEKIAKKYLSNFVECIKCANFVCSVSILIIYTL